MVVKLLLGAAFIALLVGGAATVVGATSMVSDPDAAPTCDGKIMSAGDRCDVLRGGSTVDSYTYEEKIDRQHGNKEHAGDTLTIGLTVMTVSLFAGVLVEVAFRRSGRKKLAVATTPASGPPPVTAPDMGAPASPVRATGSRRGAYRVMIAGAAGVVCAALAVAVAAVAIHLGDSHSTPTSLRGSVTATGKVNGPDVADLRRAMPAALRARSQCRSPGSMDRESFVTSSATCYLPSDSPLIRGLVAVPSLGHIVHAAIVSSPASYRYRVQQSPSDRVVRDDGAVFAVFAVFEGLGGQSDPPELANSLRCLDLRTGLFIVVNTVNNEHDAATLVGRAGF